MTKSLIFAEAAQLWREMKEDYDTHLERHYLAAEEATNGFMVNNAGRQRGLTNADVYYGPYRHHASEELREYWETHPRPRLEDYEKNWWSARKWLTA